MLISKIYNIFRLLNHLPNKLYSTCTETNNSTRTFNDSFEEVLQKELFKLQNSTEKECY